jgi:hypothetical protein
MSDPITVQCTNPHCGKKFRVTKVYAEVRGSTLCDNCLIDDQNERHGIYRPDPEDAELQFRENEREAWENRNG